ncbi:carboxylate-amine ligase [Embleya sp. AB8]|uniref:carboxylate-amine ligase n=1 Tax=Embleya sp. AB8 TaxID=3156304 RepID=UPI003C7436A9
MVSTDDRMPTLGVEEEYFLVHADTGAVAEGGTRVLARARAVSGELISGELTEYQIEAKTRPCTTAAELIGQLTRMRAVTAAAAGAEGLRIVASGTPIVGAREPVPIRDDPRYLDGLEEFRALNDSYAVCAMHTHVHVPVRAEAVLVSNHLRPWLPILVAMAANSPYWAERDSGYASWRTLAGSRWPVAGPPPYFSSEDHYDRLAEVLGEAGATLGARTLFWDVRPCAHLPTVEIRAMDVGADVEETAVFAILVRALVVRALERVRRGDPGPLLSDALLRAAYWRAARDGWSGRGLDVRDHRLVPMTDLVRQLVAYVRPVLVEYGELSLVIRVLRDRAGRGGGAERQRAAFARRADLRDVVDHLADHTTGSKPPTHATPAAARSR